MKNPSFEYFEMHHSTAGLLYSDKEGPYPFRIHYWHESHYMIWHDQNADNTFYGFVHDGIAELTCKSHNGYQFTQVLAPGMSFCCVGNFSIVGGQGIIIERKKFDRGWMQVVGPIEKEGRLKYIDGCTDTLLIPPVKKGDPCLNHLHFPPAITQTPHTHPTVRVGIVHKGYGKCVTPWGNIVLKPGMIFVIHENEQPGNMNKVAMPRWTPKIKIQAPDLSKGGDLTNHIEILEGIPGTHSFNTGDTSSMDVIAWHPDSDFGPTDEDHPMINRTIVEGISAKHIDGIRTQ